MSYVNGTQHYNLPQTVGTDKRDWADTNQAFADVDAALYQAVETAGDASTAVAALDAQVNGTGGVVERVSAAENDIDTVEGSVATLQTTVANHTSQIADVRRDDQDMITAFNEPDATSDHAYSVGDYFIYNDILYKATASIAVGATIVPNTNCAATNVTTEIKDNVVDISGKQDKTDNSLTTTSKQVVGAINELNSDLSKSNRDLLVSIPNAQNFNSHALDSGKKISDYKSIGFTVLNAGAIECVAEISVHFFIGFTDYNNNRFCVPTINENLICQYVDDTHIIARASATGRTVNVFGIN